MKTILIHDISSISENIFSFKNKGGVINEEPLRLKQKQERSRSVAII
jgi:hypothetical protein